MTTAARAWPVEAAAASWSKPTHPLVVVSAACGGGAAYSAAGLSALMAAMPPSPPTAAPVAAMLAGAAVTVAALAATAADPYYHPPLPSAQAPADTILGFAGGGGGFYTHGGYGEGSGPYTTRTGGLSFEDWRTRRRQSAIQRLLASGRQLYGDGGFGGGGDRLRRCGRAGLSQPARQCPGRLCSGRPRSRDDARGSLL